MNPPKGNKLEVETRLHNHLIIAGLWTLTCILGLSFIRTTTPSEHIIQKCAINQIHKNLSFLDTAEPITTSEFINRQDTLAKALSSSNIAAFVLEPGYTFQYYGNISQTDWEPWEPEERPFLMIITPINDTETGEIRAKTRFLAPRFEEGRVRMLGIPTAETELEIVTWEEHWNPYATLKKDMFNGEDVVLMVDEEMRDFIVRGLTNADFATVGLSGDVAAVRQVKSSAEVEILRAVNTGTVEAIRAVRSCLVPGLTENQVIRILDNTMLSIGFSLFFNIVLFDANAALPHGGFKTGDKVLERDTLVLVDVGAHYLRYSSDVSRTFFIPPSAGLKMRLFSLLFSRRWFTYDEVDHDSKSHEEKVKVWYLVKRAQEEAAKMFKPNCTAADVDIAARSIIRDAGYGDMKHRVGHGIGIKAHEAPYLNQANTQRLRAGMTFTNEPGVYLEGKFGVRHEDVYLVKEDGDAEVLSGVEAVGPYEP